MSVRFDDVIFVLKNFANYLVNYVATTITTTTARQLSAELMKCSSSCMSKTRKCQGVFMRERCGGGRGKKVCGEAVTRFATAQIVCQFSTRIASNRRGSTRLECLNRLWAVHAVYSDCMFIALYSRIPYKAV